MSAQEHNAVAADFQDKGHTNGANGTATHDHAAAAKARAYDYGGNPLAHVNTGESVRLQAFGGDLQPGLYRPPNRKLANPAPLGLCGFALTTFLLSLINLGVRDITEPSLVIGPAFAYGGLVQLLAGMWEIAVGNTFGGTALASYGGFWIGTAIILTPGGFAIQDTLLEGSVKAGVAGPAGKFNPEFYNSFGLYLMGWFIFTTLLLFCTLKSTVAFFFLFFTLDLAFLCLGIGYLYNEGGSAPNKKLIKAGGVFGILAAFMAWYNALAGIADPSNSLFIIPVAHFPWSDKGRQARGKTVEHEHDV